MVQEQMQRCLAVVAAYRASGHKSKLWAQAKGVPARVLASWSAHSRRWQARFDGVDAPTAPPPKPKGFVAAREAPGSTPATVQIEVNCGAGRLDPHWPLTHAIELAALVRELNR